MTPGGEAATDAWSHFVNLGFPSGNLVVAWALLQSVAGSSAEGRYAFT